MNSEKLKNSAHPSHTREDLAVWEHEKEQAAARKTDPAPSRPESDAVSTRARVLGNDDVH